MLFPKVLAFPEKVRLSSTTKKDKPVLLFEKNINGKYTVVTVKSDKHKDLFIQTAYIGMKKGTLAAGIDEQATINTSETLRGTDSSLSSILPQAEKNVNSLEEESFSSPDRRTEQTRIVGDERAKRAAEIATIKAELRGKSPKEIAELSRQARQKNKQNGNNSSGNGGKPSNGNGSGNSGR